MNAHDVPFGEHLYLRPEFLKLYETHKNSRTATACVETDELVSKKQAKRPIFCGILIIIWSL